MWPEFDEEMQDAVKAVLKSGEVNYWTGKEGRQFETEFATFAGTNHAIAVANGTLALDLIWQGLGIGSHYGGKATDEVIVTSRSFMASASSIVNAGARPRFADVGLDSGNIEPNTVAAQITENTRAILCVHLAGWPCDMDGILEATEESDIHLVEDCAQAHGAFYKGRPVGSLGTAAAWSFCQDKIMTTGGEGGMVTCQDEDLWKRMWAFKDHGKSWDAIYNRQHAPGFRWLHESFGTNWRLTEMQSAIGRIQLTRMSGWTAARTENARQLTLALTEADAGRNIIRIPELKHESAVSMAREEINSRHAWYKYYAYVVPENLPSGWDRDRIVAEISAKGVTCMQGSCSEMYLEKSFEGTGLRPSKALPNARKLGQTSLMFLVHPTLSAQDMADTTHAIYDVISNI